MALTPKVGLRFNHRRVLSTEPFDGKTPQIYQITKIACGWVYYRPVYAAGLTEERLGASDCCAVDVFDTYAAPAAVAA